VLGFVVTFYLLGVAARSAAPPPEGSRPLIRDRMSVSYVD